MSSGSNKRDRDGIGIGKSSVVDSTNINDQIDCSVYKEPSLLTRLFIGSNGYNVVTLLRYLVTSIDKVENNLERSIKKVFNYPYDSIEYRDFLLNSFVCSKPINNPNKYDSNVQINEKKRVYHQSVQENSNYFKLLSLIKKVAKGSHTSIISLNFSQSHNVEQNSMIGFILSSPYFELLIERHFNEISEILSRNWLFVRTKYNKNLYIQVSGIPISTFFDSIKDRDKNKPQSSSSQPPTQLEITIEQQQQNVDKKGRQPKWKRDKEKRNNLKLLNQEKQKKENNELKQKRKLEKQQQQNKPKQPPSLPIKRLKNNLNESTIIEHPKNQIIHSHILYSSSLSSTSAQNKFINNLKSKGVGKKCKQDGTIDMVCKNNSKRLIWYIFSRPLTCMSIIISKLYPSPSNEIRMSNCFKSNITLFEKVLKEISKSKRFTSILNSLCKKLPNSNHHSNRSKISIIQSTQIDLKSLIDNNIPIQTVYNFLVIITNIVFPFNGFWGTISNINHFHHGIIKYLVQTKSKTFRLIDFCKGFNLNDLPFLNHHHTTGSGGSINLMNDSSKFQYLKRFIWWLFEEIIPSVIRNYFYCTESQLNSQSIIYYRKEDWFKLTSIQCENLQFKNYKPIYFVSYETLAARKFGVSQLRFIPKTQNLRPIVNSKINNGTIPIFNETNSTIVQLEFPQSINESLAEYAFPILKFEIKNNPKLVGSSVFSKRDVYEKFKSIKDQLGLAIGSGKKLYFISVDINKCYDNIVQSKLIEVLDKFVFVNPVYQLQKISTVGLKRTSNYTPFTLIKTVASTLQTRSNNNNSRASEKENFLSTVENYYTGIERTSQQLVIQDKLYRTTITRYQIITLFKQHILNHYIKFGSQMFHQVIGIAQGSLCSPHLCSLFLGDLENRILLPKLDNNNGSGNGTFNFLIRFIDDYLYVTTSRSNIQQFKQTFQQGVPEYGIKSNNSKTKYYIDDQDQSGIIKRGEYNFIAWCGFFVNCNTMEIQKNYSLLSGKKNCDVYVYYSFNENTIDQNELCGDWRDQLYKFLISKIHSTGQSILFDPNINSVVTIYINIYQILLYTSIKFCCWVNEFYHCLNVSDSQLLYDQVVHRVSYFIYIYKVLNVSNGFNYINMNEIVWLTCTALLKIVSKKHTQYHGLIKLLKQKLKFLNFDFKNSKTCFIKQKFKDIIKDNLSIDILNIIY